MPFHQDRGFEDGQYYYRFAEDEATSVLNIARKFEGTARSASALAEDIRRQILALYASYLADDGSYVDYAGTIATAAKSRQPPKAKAPHTHRVGCPLIMHRHCRVDRV